jgi:hypothetical protein
MAGYYVPLPGAQAPRNALIDFSPINQGISAVRDQNNQNRNALMQQQQLDMRKDESQYQRGRDAKQDARQQVEWFGNAASAVERLQGPQRAAAWQRVISRHGADGLSPEELDPMTGPQMLMAAAGKWRDPRDDQMRDLDLQMKQAQIGKINREASDAGAAFGKNGTIVQDRDGNFYSVQFGAGGQKKVEPLRLGEQALQPSRGVETVGDTMRDKATGRVVENIGPNLAGAERAKGIGEAQGKAIAAAPGDISSADTALELIGSIRNDPGRKQGTGFSSVMNRVPGTAGYDFQRKNDQATSGAFLTAIQQLRGMGALSNAEGQTATAAVNRMNTSQTEEGYLEALADYERLVMKGKVQAQMRLQGGGQIPQGGGAVQQPQQQPRPDPMGLFGGN